MATQRQSEVLSDDEAFREEVQAFLRDNFPEELKNKGTKEFVFRLFEVGETA